MDLPELDPETPTAPAAGVLDRVLGELSAGGDEQDVLARAARLAVALTGADAVLVCEGAEVVATAAGGTSGGAAVAPGGRGLARVLRERGGVLTVPGGQRWRTSAVPVPGLPDVQLLAARRVGPDEGPRAQDGQDAGRDAVQLDAVQLDALRLVARCAGLTVLAGEARERGRRTRPAEPRALAERTRLRAALQAREDVLGGVEAVRRSVAGSDPLPQLLERAAATCSGLLGGRPVSVVLAGPPPAPRSALPAPRGRVVAVAGDPVLDAAEALRAAAELRGVGVDPGDETRPAAAAVVADGACAGALVVGTTARGPLDPAAVELLRAAAEVLAPVLAAAGAAHPRQTPGAAPADRATLLRHLDAALRAQVVDGLGASVLVLAADGPAAQDGAARLLRGLRGRLRAGDLAARVGADGVAVVLRDAEPERAARRCVALLREDLAAQPGGAALRAGIAVADGPVGAADLLGRADSALHLAAPAGGGGPGGPVVVFGAQRHPAPALRRALESDVRRGLAEGEFELVLHPVVRLADGAATGLDAGLRWHHRVRGTLDPGSFLAGADRSPALDALWRWVLASACGHAAALRRGGPGPGLPVAVHLSAAHLTSRTAVEDVRAALADAGLEPGALVLAVPAPALAATGPDDVELVAARLRRLRAAGAAVVLTGVTTGPEGGPEGALAWARRLPLDGVELAEGLVEVLDDPAAVRGRAAVRALCELGAALDLPVAACGVRRAGQARVLADLGCAAARGPLLGAARPADRVAADLAAGTLFPLALGPVPPVPPVVAVPDAPAVPAPVAPAALPAPRPAAPAGRRASLAGLRPHLLRNVLAGAR